MQNLLIQNLLIINLLFFEACVKSEREIYKSLKERNKLGWINVQKNNLKGARKQFKIVLSKDPNNFMALWGLGVILGKEAEKESSVNKLNQAIKILEKAKKLSNNNPYVTASLVKAYIDKGCYNKFILKKRSKYFTIAEKLCKEVTKINPKLGIIYFNWAVILFYKEKYKDALVKLQKARELHYPVSDKFWNNLKNKMNKK